MEPEPVEKEENSWGERWQEVHKEYECVLCHNRDYGLNFIICCECQTAFHKICLDPLRSTPWPDGEEWICEECDYFCVACQNSEPPDQPERSSQEEDVLFEWYSCVECGDRYHTVCLEEEDQHWFQSEEKDSEPYWMCPDCLEIEKEEEEWEAENNLSDGEVDEPFHRSECSCDQCQESNTIVDSWKTTQPRNEVDAFIARAIDAMEEKVNFMNDDDQFLHGTSNH